MKKPGFSDRACGSDSQANSFIRLKPSREPDVLKFARYPPNLPRKRVKHIPILHLDLGVPIKPIPSALADHQAREFIQTRLGGSGAPATGMESNPTICQKGQDIRCMKPHGDCARGPTDKVSVVCDFALFTIPEFFDCLIVCHTNTIA